MLPKLDPFPMAWAIFLDFSCDFLQVIGYSDSRDFLAKVGPSPASEGEGRFANLVESRVVIDGASREGPKEQQQQQQQQLKPRKQLDIERSRSRPPQPLLKPSLFDWLPPPGSSAKAS